VVGDGHLLRSVCFHDFLVKGDRVQNASRYRNGMGSFNGKDWKRLEKMELAH
jgi:hypothetical protein